MLEFYKNSHCFPKYVFNIDDNLRYNSQIVTIVLSLFVSIALYKQRLPDLS